MSWITKNLTLDLLAITIDGLNKVFTRINNEPDGGNWPPIEPTTPQAVEAPAADVGVGGPVENQETTPEPAAAESQPEPTPAAEPTPEPDLDPEALLNEAKNTLRSIAMTDGGTTWITDTLFPQYHVTTLTDVPTDKLPGLIDQAHEHLKAAA